MMRPHYALQERLHDIADTGLRAFSGHSDVALFNPAPARAIPAPDVPARVDAHTISMLQSYAASASADSYNDGALARELLTLAGSQPLPGVAPERRWIMVQRIALAGRFLNEAFADPLLSVDLRSLNESVRFPLFKAALADATTLTAATHLLRSLVHELMWNCVSAHLFDNGDARRIAGLLRQLLVQFDLAPAFVREVILTAQPIDEPQISRFSELQQRQALQRRNMVSDEARRRVARELEQSTIGRDVPAPALRFLSAVWGPLLTDLLLRHGAAHSRWKAGLILMEQLLDQLDARDPDAPEPRAWHELTRTLHDGLAAGGAAPDHIDEALAELTAARQAPRSASDLDVYRLGAAAHRNNAADSSCGLTGLLM